MSLWLYTTAVVFYQRIARSHAAHDVADRLTKAGLKAEARFVAVNGAGETVELSGGVTRDIRTLSWDEALAMFEKPKAPEQPARPKLKVKRLTETAKLPVRGSPRAAGLDICYDGAKPITFYSGDRYALATGLAMTVPDGTYARVAPRSGLGFKGLDVWAGVVDEDYTGEVKVLLVAGVIQAPITIEPGDRIAQVILERIILADVEDVEELDTTQRGDGGFGSTGR